MISKKEEISSITKNKKNDIELKDIGKVIQENDVNQPIGNKINDVNNKMPCKNNNLTDKTTENFANFFNGEVIDMDKNN